AHQRQGQPVALLTGTPDFIARPLAALLGVETVAATRCVTHGTRFCAAPPPLHPLGAGKLQQAARLCQDLGVALGETTAYADSIHDRPLLEHVGCPVAVAPDRLLLRLARERGWEI